MNHLDRVMEATRILTQAIENMEYLDISECLDVDVSEEDERAIVDLVRNARVVIE